MINPTIEKLVNNEITPIKQNEEEVTYSPNISHEEELLDFNNLTNIQIFNKIRGLSSNPGAYFKIDNFAIKVYESQLSEKNSNMEKLHAVANVLLEKEKIDGDEFLSIMEG